jgi:hypothetical protein
MFSEVLIISISLAGFEVLPVEVMGSSIFRNMTPCSLPGMKHFGGMCSLHPQSRGVMQARNLSFLAQAEVMAFLKKSLCFDLLNPGFLLG